MWNSAEYHCWELLLAIFVGDTYWRLFLEQSLMLIIDVVPVTSSDLMSRNHYIIDAIMDTDNGEIIYNRWSSWDIIQIYNH